MFTLPLRLRGTPRFGQLVALVAAAVIGLGALGCRSKPSEPQPVASAQPVASGVGEAALRAARQKLVEQTLNPKGMDPYSGPVGVVSGVVQISGDDPPELAEVLAAIPEGKCQQARSMYGVLFRQGMTRSVADALVAVTGYAGYLPAVTDEPKLVKARGCAWDARTIAVPFGQDLAVLNRDGEAYMPQLIGAPTHALLVAMPGGEPVKLFPHKPGQYALSDKVHPFMHADVFVMNYPTFEVTDLDGQYEIRGIPAGEVTVSAMLPITGRTVQKKVTVEAGKTAKVDLVIPFQREEDFDARKVLQRVRAQGG